jgi:hypothetical protein
MRSSALPAPMKPQAAVSVTASPATPSPGTGGGADPASIFSGITITELESSTCRWPLWNGFDEGVKLYCGCEVSVGPYCPAHAHIAYVPYVPRVVASREWQRA